MTPLDGAAALTESVLHPYSLSWLFSTDHVLVEWFLQNKRSGSHYSAFFFLAKKKRKRKDKTGSNFFYNWLFFSIKNNNYLFDCSRFISPTLRFFCSFNGCLSRNAKFFSMQQQRIDGFGVNVSGRQQREKPAGRSWFGFCPFLLTLRLIDERVCGELSWTHLLLFQREVCKS